jgi:hypothetical protein
MSTGVTEGYGTIMWNGQLPCGAPSQNPPCRAIDAGAINMSRCVGWGGAGICGQRRTASLRYWFAADSSLEEAGFEPSVPRDTTKFSMPAHVTYAWFPARGKVGASEYRHHEDAGRLPRNRWFESCSLQRGVHYKLGWTR